MLSTFCNSINYQTKIIIFIKTTMVISMLHPLVVFHGSREDNIFRSISLGAESVLIIMVTAPKFISFTTC